MPKLSPPDYCRQKSCQCEEASRRVLNEDLKLTYRDLAFRWQELAALKDRMEREKVKPQW